MLPTIKTQAINTLQCTPKTISALLYNDSWIIVYITKDKFR